MLKLDTIMANVELEWCKNGINGCVFELRVMCPNRKLHFLSNVSKSLLSGIISFLFSTVTLFNLAAPGCLSLHFLEYFLVLFHHYHSATVLHFSGQLKSMEMPFFSFPVRSFLCDCCWMWSVLDNSRRPLKQSRPEPQQRLALTGKKN